MQHNIRSKVRVATGVQPRSNFVFLAISAAILAMVMLFTMTTIAVQAQDVELTAIQHNAETFARQGDQVGGSITIADGFFQVGTEIYVLTSKEEVFATIKIRYAPQGSFPNQSYQFADAVIQNAPKMKFYGIKDGYATFSGSLSVYDPATGPAILALELFANLESDNQFDFIVEIDGQNVDSNSVSVRIGDEEPVTADFSVIMMAEPAEAKEGEIVHVTIGTSSDATLPVGAQLKVELPDRLETRELKFRPGHPGSSFVFTTTITATTLIMATIIPGEGAFDPNPENNQAVACVILIAPAPPTCQGICPQVYLPLVTR